MSIARELSRGLRELKRALEYPTFLWNNKTVSCLPGSAAATQTLGPGGWSLEGDVTLIVLAEDLPAPSPQELQTITYLGKTYRIDKMEALPGGAGVVLTCNDPRPRA